MLYILRSPHKDSGTILKVGYTKDRKYRFSQYEACNPSIVEIGHKEGDRVDESVLHLYLHDLGYNRYKYEWYKDCQEVIDIFNMGQEKINEEVWKKRNKIFTKARVRSNPVMEEAYVRLLGTFGVAGGEEEIDKYYRSFSERRAAKKLLNDLSQRIDLNEKEELLRTFLSTPGFPAKMRFLCESNFGDGDINFILNNIPSQYKNFYLILGKDRCKACGYIVTRLNKELSDIEADSGKLSEMIYKRFEIGKKYTKVEIKEAIREIYNSIGYNRPPKANDIELYFEVADCRTPNKETGKRDHGFKLLKKKGE